MIWKPRTADFAAGCFVLSDELVQLEEELEGVLIIGGAVGCGYSGVEGGLGIFQWMRAVHARRLVELAK